MRRFGIFISVALAALAVSAMAYGRLNDTGPDRPAAIRTVTAVGSATVHGKADAARLYFGVRSSGKTVPIARAENTKAVKKFREAVAALKNASLRLRTTATGVHAVHVPYTNNLTGYDVYQSFAILITDQDPEKLAAAAEQLLDVALESGANHDGQVYFFQADDLELRREAMRKAVEDALASAKAYAAGAKATIAEVVKIEDGSSRWDVEGDAGVRGGLANPFGGETPHKTSLAVGAWEVTIRVRIVCRY